MSRTEWLLLAQLGKFVVSSSLFYYVCLRQQLKSWVRVRSTALPNNRKILAEKPRSEDETSRAR